MSKTINNSSRRGFLKGAAVAAGALGVSRLLPGMQMPEAHAAPGAEPSALCIIHLNGGYNALFPSPDAFIGSGAFGVTADNVLRVGTSPLFMDRATLGTLSATTRQKMASIGVAHGISSHATAQPALVLNGTKSRLVQMSAALGGTAAVRCVTMGGFMPAGTHPAMGDVSLQQIRDLATTIAALGGTASANAPERTLAADGIAAAEAMSKAKLDVNKTSGRTLTEGYPTASAQLRQATVALNYAEMCTAYGVPMGSTGTYPTDVTNPRRQIMGAELMIRAGANVVFAGQVGWDTHGDRNGNTVRDKITMNGTMAAIKAFTDRTLAMTGRNVVTVITGDFSRSLPGSDHASNLTATVIGKYVKTGTTGRVNAQVGLPAGTPGINGLWAYLGAVLGASGAPFGANPHNLVLA